MKGVKEKDAFLSPAEEYELNAVVAVNPELERQRQVLQQKEKEWEKIRSLLESQVADAQRKAADWRLKYIQLEAAYYELERKYKNVLVQLEREETAKNGHHPEQIGRR
jgi:hypothetical protein